MALAFEEFDFWMKRDTRHNGTPSDKLVKWLSSAHGGRLITNYEEFVELATQLNSRGYDIPEAPSKSQFENGMSKKSTCNPQSHAKRFSIF